MKRLLVTGAGGMLGKRVVNQAKERNWEVTGVTHQQLPIEQEDIVQQAFTSLQPDILINCAGAIPARSDDEAMKKTNSLGPQVLARLAPPSCSIIHMSTDCVFSGDIPAGLRYLPRDKSDAKDVYGQTKAQGELPERCLVVRGSFIGPEHGFLHWLLTSKDVLRLWNKAWWNGTTAENMAKCLLDLAEQQQTGVVHVSSEEAQTKAELAQSILKGLELPTPYTLEDEPRINRVLAPTIICQPLTKTVRDIVKRYAHA